MPNDFWVTLLFGATDLPLLYYVSILHTFTSVHNSIYFLFIVIYSCYCVILNFTCETRAWYLWVFGVNIYFFSFFENFFSLKIWIVRALWDATVDEIWNTGQKHFVLFHQKYSNTTILSRVTLKWKFDW